MNKQQAIELVRKTFESRFDRDKYVYFLRELLNGFDDEGARINQGGRIPEKFQDYVEKMERVGKYTVDKSEVMLFIVTLKKETSIERARTMQRNFVAWYLARDTKDAALVAFVSRNTDDWRFSLVKMDYRFEEQAGKTKVKEEFTPVRRWSFLVGANEKSHTAQSKFVPIIEDDKNNPTLADLEDAFNIEKVTREFFEKYRDLFIRTKEALDKAVAANPAARSDFERKGIDTVNLAKKLLGQIIFLYFLQKKGWFGVPRDGAWGDGSKNFLRELFGKKKENENFFNDILEHLFYDALRNDRSHDDHYYGRFNCKIPFLNGGLFDPMNNYDWVHTDILLPDTLFSNKGMSLRGRSPKQSPADGEIASTEDRRLATLAPGASAGVTWDDEGDGILDIFDRYNFTVKEDEPFEKEVAIDPELLGKTYEKFNAIRPDNYDAFLKALKSGKKGEESKFNKQYGVYYTPREIVHYMCQQSLINYLYAEVSGSRFQVSGSGNGDNSIIEDSDVELSNVGLPTKEAIALLIQHGESLREHEAQAAENETKTYSPIISESIRKNAARIDRKLAEIKICDPAVGSGAFPVGMMSEIVKARQALSVYLSPPASPPALKGIPPFSPSGSRQGENTAAKMGGTRGAYYFKRECIENSLYGVDIDPGAVEIAKLRLWLSLIVDEDDIQNIKPLPNLDYKIVQGNSLVGFPENWGSPIEKEIESLIHQHFNETNPTKKDKLKLQIDDKIASRYKNSLKTFGYQVTFDFKTVFSEVFQQNGGFDVVIGNPPYGAKLTAEQKKLFTNIYRHQNYQLDTYLLFIEKGFNLLASRRYLAFIIPNTWLNNLKLSKIRRFLFEQNTVNEINHYSAKVFEAVVDTEVIIVQKGNLNSVDVKIRLWQNLQTSKDSILPLSRIRRLNGEPVNIFTTDAQELVVEKMRVNTKLLGEICNVAAGVKPYEVGHGEPPQTQAMVDKRVYDSTTQKDKSYRPLLRGKDIEKYLIKWDGSRWIKYGKNLGAPRKPENYFVPEKLVIRQTGDSLVATIDTSQFVCMNNMHTINTLDESQNLHFILGLINSKLLNFYFQNLNPEAGEALAEVKKEHVEKLVIINAKPSHQKPVIALVDRILAAKRANPQADTSAWETEIDQLVYALYGLTVKEIKIVEGI